MSVFVAVDVGYGVTKIATDHGRNSILSLVAPDTERQKLTVDFGFRKIAKPYERITVNGKSYFVGESASNHAPDLVRQNRDQKRIFGDDYATLIASALLSMDIDDAEEIFLFLDLPLSELEDNQTKLRKEYKGKVLDIVDAKENKKKYTLSKVSVIGQGVAALYSHLNENEIMNGSYAVIEIGSRTTDFAVYKNMELLEGQYGSIDSAMLQIIDEFTRKAESAHVMMDFTFADQLIRNYEITKSIIVKSEEGQQIDLTSTFKAIVESVCIHTLNRVIPRFKNITRLDGIVIAGGGAKLFYPYIFDMIGSKTELSIAQDPQYANAVGALRIAHLRWD
ncbi:MAG: ParM/StbA family protein [Acidibacillus sp.]|nr:ParM/StbA family protein [Acidibacillus sp.]